MGKKKGGAAKAKKLARKAEQERIQKQVRFLFIGSGLSPQRDGRPISPIPQRRLEGLTP